MRATADPSTARDDIVLVDIDEQSIRALAPYFGRWPWPRLVHAHLLDFLARSRPKVVLYDILFGEPDRSRFTIGDDQWTGEQSDNELAGSARKLGSVVFVGDATEEASARDSGVSSTVASVRAVDRTPPALQPADARTARRVTWRRPQSARAGCRRRRAALHPVRSRRRHHDSRPGRRGRHRGARAAHVRCAIRGRWILARRSPDTAGRVGGTDARRRHARRAAAAHRLPGRMAGPAADLSRRTRSRSCFNPRNSCWQARKPTSIRRPSTARSSSSARRLPGSTTRRPCPSRRRCRAPRSTPTSWTASCRAVSSRRPARSTSVLLTLVAALGTACIVVLVGTWPGVASALIAGGRSRLRPDQPVRQGHLGAAGRTAAGGDARGVQRRHLSVRLRRPREAPREAAVFQVRLEGRIPAAAVEPGRRETRRRAAPHVGVLLRHPRLHGGIGAWRARGHRHAAEPVLLRAWCRSCSRIRVLWTSSSAT